MDGLLGYRDVQETKRLYEADKALHGGIPSGKVAEPGTSWHECNLAVDMDGPFWESTSKSLWLYKDRLHQQLNLYGLMLPLNTVDSPSVLEWWHLQPVETNGIPGTKRMAFLDPDDLIIGDDEMQWSKEILTARVKAYQKSNGLSSDGIAGPITIQKLLEDIDLTDKENSSLRLRLNDIRAKATL
jgi:hypothetical protein